MAHHLISAMIVVEADSAEEAATIVVNMLHEPVVMAAIGIAGSTDEPESVADEAAEWLSNN